MVFKSFSVLIIFMPQTIDPEKKARNRETVRETALQVINRQGYLISPNISNRIDVSQHSAATLLGYHYEDLGFDRTYVEGMWIYTRKGENVSLEKAKMEIELRKPKHYTEKTESPKERMSLGEWMKKTVEKMGKSRMTDFVSVFKEYYGKKPKANDKIAMGDQLNELINGGTFVVLDEGYVSLKK